MNEHVEQIKCALEMNGIFFSERKIEKKLNNLHCQYQKYPLSQVYKNYLINLAKKRLIFRNILNKKRVFDFSFQLKTIKCEKKNLKKMLKKSFKGRVEYIYIQKIESKYLIYIKFILNRIYKPLKTNMDISKHVIPYFLVERALSKSYNFNEITFNEFCIENFDMQTNEKQKISEIINHLRELILPLKVIDSYCFSSYYKKTLACNELHEFMLQLETSKQWPNDAEARKIAKTAFYCLIFKKSRYKHKICPDYVILKCKGSFFKFTIKLKDEMTIDILLHKFAEIIKGKSKIFHEAVIFMKRYLGAHGYYPLHLSDIYIEAIALYLYDNEMPIGLFVRKFMEFDFNMKSKTFNITLNQFHDNNYDKLCIKLDNCCEIIDNPNRDIMRRLCLLNKKVINSNLQTISSKFTIKNNMFFKPCLNDYDLVFSMKAKFEYESIIDRQISDFPLGVPSTLSDNRLLRDLEEFAYFFYSPTYEILMVKVFDYNNLALVTNLILLQTSFKFLKVFNSKNFN
ncbi:hypothetical protein EDEG_02184 [Edhazardia aedis USNM 41457]|uniref:U3 small nucleolar RNA-associated protein 22 n=1 Tax=Edhazardia aedis (strain USNM 41457) TaxID=1003232 RepID=J8ZUY2_EDHAE|nr:hypothetical protein EDEG_02184 [Edhazardia aedis USNM 41457]|eukprot:EJW03488.1 hypothetical protein EDEG_02184 [Edhazardia aedis USNM 41457]